MNLFLLPVVSLTICFTTAQLQSTTQKLYSCNMTLYPDTLYKMDNLLGYDQWLKADTLDECGTLCLQKNGCRAINFEINDNLCALLGSGLPNANADKDLYDEDPLVIHAVITCNRRPSGPVGCGTQAAAYKPLLKKNTRIISGREAKPHSWPWMVAMSIDKRDGFVGDCGSSLLRIKDGIEKSDVILTAAHCVTKEKTMGTKPKAFDADQISVVVGEHNKDRYDDGEESRTGAEIRFHPKFKFTPSDGAVYDLALVKLDTAIDFTDTIRPICLPRANESLPVGKTCMAAGWGRNNSKDENEAPTALQQLLTPAQNASTCQNGWFSTYKEDIHICAGTLNGVSGTCHGDSGGMLACKETDGSWILYGATSFGVDVTCLEAGKPGIFTRLSSFVDWINKNMKEITSL